MAQHLETAAPAGATGEHVEQPGSRLGPFLCWAVIFADIGTSVYYTPGILFGDPKHGIGVGDLAGLFVSMTIIVFLLLTLKYAEVSVRFPEGGGVVTVSARGINPWAGAVGGMFILVDYFLTSAISSLSGVQYFESLVPALNSIIVQLVITLILVALLGLLNWYGIKESAMVSAAIAVAAFVSDILILVTVFIHVPPHVIGEVFAMMFRGHNLTVPLVLTGYAGAFLAFSGLETVSQLSPVMKLPRNKTVTRALALVVVTVGITSPLLTIFSTTLLTHPELLRQTSLVAPPPMSLQSLQNQFISQLGYSSGGVMLGVFTAVTAATLLVFASNTAIIGAYHVFLALSKMQFFPKFVERRNKLRGTPHVSIFLSTVIPMGVLIAVGGRIDLLGDMYAFGLLGAFSLTCLSLDFIRWRERHGARPVGTQGEHDVVVASQGTRPRAAPAILTRAVGGRVSPQMVARLGTARARMASARTAVYQTAAPAVIRIRGRWPDIRYYLGFLTTVLVGSAWLINLRAKPLATVFGGGLTVLGVGVSVLHYRHQQRLGQAIVQPAYFLRPMPNSRLVVLDPRSAHNAAVVRAACQTAQGHPLLILCLGYPQVHELRTFAINDAYLNDPAAQATLRLAARICASERVEATYVYRVARPNAVLDAWRVIQPDEIIAEAALAKEFAKKVAPDYLRKQQVDGATIVHAVRKRVSSLEEEPLAGQAAGVRTRLTPPTAEQGIENGVGGAEAPATQTTELGTPHVPEEPRPIVRRPVARGGTGAPPPVGRATSPPTGPAAPRERAPERAEAAPLSEQTQAGELGATGASEGPQPQPQQTGPLPANVNLDEYVWTGTDLVRRGDLEDEAAEKAPGETAGERTDETHDSPPARDDERRAPDEPHYPGGD
ncbi:MAG TPA: amino acid permease [Ktedonobacterales bacterium]